MKSYQIAWCRTNQKIVYIAIIVVVAFVVVIGLWLSGAGQNEPLSGEIGYDCEEPQLTSKCYLGAVRTEIWGTLKTSSGAPLPNQPLRVELYEKSSDTWGYWFDMTTGADGTFKVEKSGAPAYAPMIVYEGGEYNGISYCSAGVICTQTAGVPL